MNNRDVIVIGASAGGVSALKTLFRAFPADLPAAIFVVLHVSAREPSHLPSILRTRTSLRVDHAKDGETIQHGRVYVAPPDRHVVIESGHMHLNVAPRENRARPAINPLFRSAALAYGPRVIGIILSGTLDDGTAGLWEIKHRGGLAIAQSPEDAEHDQMPSNAIANVHVDYELPVAEIGPLLISLVGQAPESQLHGEESAMPETTRLTCPDCHGPIQRFRMGEVTEYRCRVGHTYSPQNMLAAHDDSEERSLWSAIESLEEGADLADELRADRNHQNGDSLKQSAEAKRTLAKTIRSAVETVSLKQK
jgi:two-component system chemotaxis response regulator CheB